MTLSIDEIYTKIKQTIESGYRFKKTPIDLKRFITKITDIDIADLDAETYSNIIPALCHEDFAEFRSQISSFKIQLYALKSSVSLYQNIVAPLLSQSSIFLPNILVDDSCASDQQKNELQFLSIKTGRVQYADKIGAYNDALCKAFYSKITALQDEVITEQKLTEIIKLISPAGDISDRYYPTHHKVSSMLKAVDWNKLFDKTNISETIHKIHHEIHIPGQIYSLKEADDLYFNIARITDGNKQKWSSLASKSSHGKNSVGVQGFHPSLKYYNNINTEVWVAFISNKPVNDPNEVDLSSTEMFVTVTTSEHSSFTTHMGIARSSSFPRDKQHKNISTKLHAFAAKFMLEQHPEKIYELNVPTNLMEEIIIKEFEDKRLVNKVFIGDNRTKYPDYNIETAKGYYEASKEYVKTDPARAFVNLMHENLRDLHLLEQRSAIEKGEKILPIQVTHSSDGSFSFIVKDQHDQIVQTITTEQQNGEFAWFFDHGWQFKNIGLIGNFQLLTCDLPTLASLGDFHGEIQLVGEAPVAHEAAAVDLAA